MIELRTYAIKGSGLWTFFAGTQQSDTLATNVRLYAFLYFSDISNYKLTTATHKSKGLYGIWAEQERGDHLHFASGECLTCERGTGGATFGANVNP